MYCLKDFIRVYDIDLPEDFLQQLLSRYESFFDTAFTVGETYNHANTIGTVRNCSVVSISDILQEQPAIELDKLVCNQLTTVLQRYHNDFPNMCCTQDTGYQLLKYEKGCFYKEHIDQTSQYLHRTLSAAILLNDDFEGGQFSFFENTYTPSLKKHQCIVFPSNFMFPHEITSVISGTRYSIVTWFF